MCSKNLLEIEVTPSYVFGMQPVQMETCADGDMSLLESGTICVGHQDMHVIVLESHKYTCLLNELVVIFPSSYHLFLTQQQKGVSSNSLVVGE